MNTKYIKSKEYTNFFISPMFCNKRIKKCIIIEKNLFAFILSPIFKLIFFYYKNENSSYSLERRTTIYLVKDIYSINENKFIYLDDKNNVYIIKVIVKNGQLNITDINQFKNASYAYVNFIYSNQFFLIENNNKFFKINYSEKSMLNFFTFHKENLKIENIFQDIKGLIDNANINDNDKKDLEAFFLFTGINNDNLGNLLKANSQFLKFFDNKNKDIYNKIKIKINENENENKYLFNSNFIYKTFKKINIDNSNDNINIEERKNIDYIVKLNNLCGNIYEKYISYLVMNSKINNIYNYKNRFLLFMGENYFINAFSLESKKFLPLSTINLFLNLDNFNNFEIKEIVNDKIILNDFKNKIIYFIENNDYFYNFCLLKK